MANDRGSFTLAEQKLVAFVASRDAARSREFYESRLGLRLVSDELPFALVFDAHGTTLRVTMVKEIAPPVYTVLGWEVNGISAAVRGIRERGIEFLRVPGLPQDEDGIWTAPGGAKIAWFRDPEGHTLSLSEHPK